MFVSKAGSWSLSVPFWLPVRTHALPLAGSTVFAMHHDVMQSSTLARTEPPVLDPLKLGTE